MATATGPFRSPQGEYLLRFSFDTKGNAGGMGNYLHTGEARRFTSLWEGIMWMEAVMDKEKFPQKSREYVSWAKPGPVNFKTDSPIRFYEEESVSTQYAASFIVRVQYRHNASWQGTVQWMEGMQALPFKSVFELMKLIDQAMERRTNTGGTLRLLETAR